MICYGSCGSPTQMWCTAAQVRAGGLHKLRLSNNALQGPLPPLVESGNLTDIAVANNNLSGAG